LRRTFTQWGLPRCLRVDNGHPWGSWSDLPRDLALWVIGLGITVSWNHPRCPEENGVVERTNGVTEGWVEPSRCADARQLRDRLVWAVQIQRAVYPAIRGRSRLEAYPQLLTPPRPYRPEHEAALWDEQRVYAFLASQVWTRRADRVGQIWLYNRGYMTVAQCKGCDVTVRFDPQAREWVILDVRGQEVRRHPAVQLTRERIIALDVTHRRVRKSEDNGVQPDGGSEGVQPDGG
jgi:hypothetical protein